MKNLKKSMSLILSALLLVSAWGTVQADDGNKGPGIRSKTVKKARRTQAIKRLNLTQEQKMAIRSHRAAYRKRKAELTGRIKVKQVEVQNELEKPAPDKAKLQVLSKEIGDLKGQALFEDSKAKVEFEKVLTPEQKEEWRQIQIEKAGDAPAKQEVDVEPEK